MIDFFTRIYTSIEEKNKFIKIFRIYSFQRFFIRAIANLLIPIYIKVTNFFTCYKLKDNKSETLLIVSLTTFPARISRVWIVIESIFRQKELPDKVILWLSKEQFADESVLPNSLLRLKKRGLEIFICDGDIKSHKKYFYVLNGFPNDILITVDDDIFYDSGLIQDLLKLHLNYPEAICCNRALNIKIQNYEIASYRDWEVLNGGGGPSFKLFQTSGGGTLFPPGTLSKQAVDQSVFMKYCKFADDIWLNIMSQMNNTKIVKSERIIGFIPIFNKRNSTLMSINVGQGENDKQLKAVRNYYKSIYGSDPLKNLFSS